MREPFSDDRKKQRGQKRKLNLLLNNIEQIVPFQDTCARYEHFHVPCGTFIQSPKTSGKVKTAFCRAWLAKTAEIMAQKPQGISFCKVVSMIDVPHLWESQIIIFYDRAYYDSFWNRDSAEQTWIPIKSQHLSLAKGRGIESKLAEKGYVETICEDDFSQKSVLWFYGDIAK